MEAGKYTLEDFQDIIAALRAPDGCPWDKEQTHRSLMPCMMEEAAEVLAAIRILEQKGNYHNLEEELGDVLLQVVMHAQIASEEGLFTMEDVITGVSEKMIRRHPHVFGDVKAQTSGQALQNWEEIKRQEKEQEEWVENPLIDIPKELPALVQAQKLHKKLEKHFGEEKTAEESLQNVSKKVDELAKESDKERINQLFGEILYDMANIAYHKDVQGEMVLLDKVENEILLHSIKS